MILIVKSEDKMAHPEGLKPPTLAFEARCSIRLSYGCILMRLESILEQATVSRDLLASPCHSFSNTKIIYFADEPLATSSLCLAISCS